MSTAQLLIISILGGVGIGLLVGLPLVLMLRRRFPVSKKVPQPGSLSATGVPVQSASTVSPRAGSPELSSQPAQSPAVKSAESAGQPAQRPGVKSEQAGTLAAEGSAMNSLPVQDPAEGSAGTESQWVPGPAGQDRSETVPQTHLTAAEQPSDLLEELRKRRREAEEKELKGVAKGYEALAETFKKFEAESKPVGEQARLKVPNLLREIENNLAVAAGSRSETSFQFKTEVFDSNRSEVDSLPVDVRGDLMQAYIDMRLANNLVRLAAEAGQKSREVEEGYTKLCEQIALRLRKIIPRLSAE